MKELNTRRSPTIASNLEYAMELQSSVSFPTTKVPALGLMTEFEIESGTVDVLLQYLREYALPSWRKSGFASFELYRTVLGGDTNHFLLIRRFDTYKQLDAMEPFADDSHAQRMTAPGFHGLPITLIRTTVMKVRADLSQRK